MSANLLDLFSGIGGFSLGLERAGFSTVAFCEIDPYCRRVLAKHWPAVPIYDDVRLVSRDRLVADGIGHIDAICGGFPCQDISLAGSGAGLAGERSGLWREYARIVGDVRPRHVIVENVAALLGRGHGEVLGDLAALGYDIEWHCIPAAAVGAPHRRDRVWIIASNGDADGNDGRQGRARRPDPATARKHIAEPALQAAATDANSRRLELQRIAQHDDEQGASRREPDGLGAWGWRDGATAADAASAGLPQLRGLFGRLARSLAAASTPWERTTEPPLCGLDDGLSSRLARPRLKALGNAVVPQIPELIGRALMEAA